MEKLVLENRKRTRQMFQTSFEELLEIGLAEKRDLYKRRFTEFNVVP